MARRDGGPVCAVVQRYFDGPRGSGVGGGVGCVQGACCAAHCEGALST